MAGKHPKNGVAVMYNNTTSEITQFHWFKAEEKYGGWIITCTSIKKIYNVAHTVYKRKI